VEGGGADFLFARSFYLPSRVVFFLREDLSNNKETKREDGTAARGGGKGGALVHLFYE